MKETISEEECLLLAVLILCGLCANSYLTYDPEYHVPKALRLLDKLLTAIDKPDGVK